MRKEVVIAIIIGISLGLVIAYGVRIARHSLSNRTTSSPTPKLFVDTSTSQSNHNLLITSPEPDEIISSNETKIIGTTTPLSMVSARSEDAASAAVADDTGTFTLELKGNPGPNLVVVDSFHPDGDQASVTFTITVSSADLTATPSGKIIKPTPKPKT